ncbi:lipoate--protein ligase family protein [Methanocella sp. MCL-LM]|uniref:lipoate--protein ligase family protein n=1 Tax=Methanocella sp. MCL-LM TaxID=3412035 RepID=UPI003C74B76F
MWRVIPLELRSAAENMAVDEAIAEGISTGLSMPTIRFYRWKPSAVTIGCFQCLQDEVNVAGCKEKGIDVVRRRTGGGAVYHDYAGEITYSVIAPERYFPKDIKASYKEICGWIIDGLSAAGIKAEFRPINDVIVNGRKISGSAQTRRQGVLTQHGTILYSVDRDSMFSVLKPSEKKLTDKAATTFKDYVTSASEEGCPSLQLLYNALLLGFTTGKSWKPGELSGEEAEAVERLVPKYCSDEWNCSR